jgi:ADP-heptose:LPS heptosyltransferase
VSREPIASIYSDILAGKIRTYKGRTIKDRLVASLIELDYSFRNGIIKGLKRILFGRLPYPDGVKKVLVFRQAGLGETVTALPALDAIRNQFKKSEIHLLTDKTAAGRPDVETIAGMGFFTHVIQFDHPGLWHIRRLIKNGGYDLYIELPLYIVSLPFEIRSMLTARLAGIKHGAGWHISSTFLMKEQQQRLFNFEYNAQRLLRILKAYKIANEGVEVKPIELPALQNNKVCLIISAGRPQNKWKGEYFKQVARYFIDKGWEVTLSGGKEDRNNSEILPEHEKVINSCGEVPIETLKDFYSGFGLIISNDTGPMHLAALSGSPMIAIFSARDYGGKWFPVEDHVHIMRNAEVACTACFSENCRNVICMDSITPEMVINKAEELLEL